MAEYWTCTNCEAVNSYIGEPDECVVCGTDNPSEQDAGGVKPRGKDYRPELVPPHAYLEWVRNLTTGARKHGDWKWMEGAEWSLFIGALKRHMEAWLKGEKRDPDGFHHLAAVMTHAAILMEYERMGLGDDDRPDWKEQHAAKPEYVAYPVQDRPTSPGYGMPRHSMGIGVTWGEPDDG